MAACFRDGQGRWSLDGNVAKGTEDKEKLFLEWGQTPPRTQQPPTSLRSQTLPDITLLSRRGRSFSAVLGTGRGILILVFFPK